MPIEVTEAPPRGRAYDYADSFAVGRSATDPRTAEEWMRAVFEGSPAVFRYGLPVAWRGFIGLRLGPRPSPGHMLGWRTVSSEPMLAVFEAESRIGEANLVLRLEPGRAVLTTFLHHLRPEIIGPVFVVAGPIHRWVVPYLLGRAAR